MASRARDFSKITVRPVVTQEETEWAFSIRHIVFVKEQGVPEEIERDEYDLSAFHVIALAGDRPVGTGRLVEMARASGKIGRMAVAAEARKKGVGASIMSALTSKAEALGCTELFLDAQVSAIGFYERLGYVAEGDVFIEAGIPHRRMRRSLST